MSTKDYTAFIEKSVLDFLQYDKKACIENVLTTVFETILKAEQKGFLGYGDGSFNPNTDGNKRNGYRKSALIKGLSSMFRVNVPRDRLGLFKPIFLELLRDETDKINDLAFKLYVKGLTTREIRETVNDIYGKNISRTTISNITNEVIVEIEKWRNKLLEEEYYAVFIDGLRVPLRRDTVSKECFYIVLGLRKDLTREVLGIYHLPEECLSGWKEVIRDLKARGMNKTLLFITDEFKYIEKAILKEYPKTKIQRCIVHKKRNILKIARNKDKKELMKDFNEVLDINNPNHTVLKAKKKLEEYIKKWGKIYPKLTRMFERKAEYFSYLRFPFTMRRMIYTNNWIEALNRQIRRTTKIRGSFPSEKSAEKLVMLRCMEIEEKYKKYPITSLLLVQDELDEKLEKMSNKPVFETHKT